MEPAASEVLYVYPVIRLLVWKQLAAKSFLISADLAFVVRRSQGQKVDSAKLEQLILQHLDSFKSIYSSADMQPKFHFSKHLPGLLGRYKLCELLVP